MPPPLPPSTNPSPLRLFTDQGVVLIEPAPLADDAPGVPRLHASSLIVQRVRRNRLVLKPSLQARFQSSWPRLAAFAILTACGLACYGLMWVLMALLRSDPIWTGDPWSVWLPALAVGHLSLAGVGLLASAASTWGRCRLHAEKKRREQWLPYLLAGAGMVAAGLLVWLVWTRGTSATMHFFGLPLLTAALGCVYLGTIALYFALLVILDLTLRPCRIVCDRQQGHVIYSDLLDFAKTLCSLDKVVAVQLLFSASEPAAGRESGAQVNLVVAEDRASRVNLGEYFSLARAREVGQALADFLEVPLVEQMGAQRAA